MWIFPSIVSIEFNASKHHVVRKDAVHSLQMVKKFHSKFTSSISYSMFYLRPRMFPNLERKCQIHEKTVAFVCLQATKWSISAVCMANHTISNRINGLTTHQNDRWPIFPIDIAKTSTKLSKWWLPVPLLRRRWSVSNSERVLVMIKWGERVREREQELRFQYHFKYDGGWSQNKRRQNKHAGDGETEYATYFVEQPGTEIVTREHAIGISNDISKKNLWVSINSHLLTSFWKSINFRNKSYFFCISSNSSDSSNSSRKFTNIAENAKLFSHRKMKSIKIRLLTAKTTFSFKRMKQISPQYPSSVVWSHGKLRE